MSTRLSKSIVIFTEVKMRIFLLGKTDFAICPGNKYLKVNNCVKLQFFD